MTSPDKLGLDNWVKYTFSKSFFMPDIMLFVCICGVVEEVREKSELEIIHLFQKENLDNEKHVRTTYNATNDILTNPTSWFHSKWQTIIINPIRCTPG